MSPGAPISWSCVVNPGGVEGVVRSRESQGGTDVGVSEVRTFEEQRLSRGRSEGVGEAIAEVELCGVASSFAEVAVSLPSNQGLLVTHGFDGYVKVIEERVE